MFSKIFSYELKYWLKKPTTYIYFITFFAIAFLIFIGTAGFFDGPEKITNQEVRIINSPFEINYMLKFFNKLFLFLLPTFIGASIYKDYKDNVHSILYSFPIIKKDYILGKFLSAFIIVSFITFSVGVAFLIGENFPNLHTSKISNLNILGYLQAYLVFTLPNMLIYGLFIFSLVTYFRNIYAGFLGIIVLFFLQSITQSIFENQPFIIALLDPFAENSVLFETQYWTLTDKNTKLIPVLDVIFYNRVLWLSLTTIVFGFVYKKFQFHEYTTQLFTKNKKGKTFIKKNFSNIQKIDLPKIPHHYSIKQQIKNSWYLSNIHFKSIVKNWMFYIITFLGLISVLFTIGRITNDADFAILPSTNIVLSIPSFFFITIIMLLTFIYSGMLIHKNRNSRMHQLIDTTATNNWVFLTSNVIAILKMQVLLLLVLMVTGICIQLFNNYYIFEIDLYLFHLFILQLSGLVIWAFVSIFIHNLLKNSYLGIFILILIWFGVSGIQQAGIKTKLLLFNFGQPIEYSDINGFGNLLNSFFVVKGYWLSFTFLLLILSYLLWFRGFPESFKERIDNMKIHFNKTLKIITLAFSVSLISFGFTIFNAEKKLSRNEVIKPNDALTAFKKSFKTFSKITNQPKIISANLELDIFPDERNFTVKGNFILVNKSSKKIDTLLIKAGFDEITKYTLNTGYKILKEDFYFNFKVLKLTKSLLPNDSLTLNYLIRNKENTLFERNSNVLKNGTFLKDDFLPSFGYFLDNKIKNPTNSLAKLNQLGSLNTDFINLSTVISTSKNQTAIAPGTLVKRWQSDNRNYYHYKTQEKIKFSLAFISGEFQVKKENYKHVDFEIYHHKNHHQNIDKMMHGLKAGFDYNTKNFGKYLHKEIRVVEFPKSEGVFATIMGNMIPTSERRFMANSISKNQFDSSFKVQAHEITHHWWGNQLVHANALGAGLLSESITDYITLKNFEHQFGKEKKLQFLKFQRRRYLRGSIENTIEAPLNLAHPKDIYLSYGKGSIAFNTLSNYIGEDKLNNILKTFIDNYRMKEGNYPTSIDLIKSLKKATPDSLQYIIKDYFEGVIYYDAKVKNTKIEEIGNEFKIDIHFQFSKFNKSLNNKERKESLYLRDYIEIGFYDKEDKLIQIKTFLINKKDNRISIYLNKKVSKIILDPQLLLLEKNITDNSINI